MTEKNPIVPGEGELPPLPEPWKASSTLKCTACGAPYEPARARVPVAAGNPFARAMSSGACKCGNAQFGGTFGYDSPSPAQFTAGQMRDYARAALAAHSASRSVAEDRGGVAVPDGWTQVVKEREGSVWLDITAPDGSMIQLPWTVGTVGAKIMREFAAALAITPQASAALPQPASPDVAKMVEANRFVYDDHIRPIRSGDDESFPGLSWSDFGSSRQHPCVINARGRTTLRDGDWIVKIDTQYHAFTPEVYAILASRHRRTRCCRNPGDPRRFVQLHPRAVGSPRGAGLPGMRRL